LQSPVYTCKKAVANKKEKKKNAKFYLSTSGGKNFLSGLNGATGGLNKKSLSVVRLRHQKNDFLNC